MPLAGTQLTIEQALALCNVRGWSGTDLTTAVAVMTAESGRFTGAWHDNLDPAGVIVSTDRGLFQVNDVAHPDLSDVRAYDGVKNAAYSYLLWSANGWAPWAAYNSGAWEKFRSDIRRVRLTHPWRWRRLKATIDEVVSALP
jgi:hypothetical protein